MTPIRYRPLPQNQPWGARLPVGATGTISKVTSCHNGRYERHSSVETALPGIVRLAEIHGVADRTSGAPCWTSASGSPSRHCRTRARTQSTYCHRQAVAPTAEANVAGYASPGTFRRVRSHTGPVK